MKTIIVIPARLASSRLPRKILADIHGHSMLWHVYQRCLQAKKIAEVHVATDSEEIMQEVASWQGKAWLTDPNCASGTERIVSLLDKLSSDIIVNVQGDQPLIEPSVIDALVNVFECTTPLPDIVTPGCQIYDDSIFDPNVVKIVKRHDGYALYFSRHPVPYVRDEMQTDWMKKTAFWGHVGIYGYLRKTLEDYPNLPPSLLEEMEKLEQLRFLQAGKTIFTFETTHHALSVDTPVDLEKVRQMLNHS